MSRREQDRSRCNSRRLTGSLCRVKQLKEEPYTQKTAEAAVGLWTDNKGPQKKEATDVDMS